MLDAARIPVLAAYKDFSPSRKDAEPDIAILKAAETEYAKMQ
jgi:hypothetical protein